MFSILCNLQERNFAVYTSFNFTNTSIYTQAKVMSIVYSFTITDDYWYSAGSGKRDHERYGGSYWHVIMMITACICKQTFE